MQPEVVGLCEMIAPQGPAIMAIAIVQGQ